MTDRDNGVGVLEEETRFVVYGVLLKNASNLTDAIRRRLGFCEDDTYIEIHVPDVVQSDGQKLVLAAFVDGFKKLAKFLDEHGIQPKALVGITHGGVAVWAGRYLNFVLTKDIEESELDEITLRRINEGFAKTDRAARGKERGPIYLCSQTFESFMQKFGSRTSAAAHAEATA